MTVLDAIIQSLNLAGAYNRDDQVTPGVILWPDRKPCNRFYGGGSIGWHPDLDDGVRLNIRPFMAADVLRKRPNIKWGKDRGKNPSGSPWGEERDNDRHLTLAEKRAVQRGGMSANRQRF